MLRPKPVEVKALNNYCLYVVFDNGERKIFDVKPLMTGEWFGQLKNVSIFESVKIVGSTVEWADGQDVCPDDLYYCSIPV